MYFIKTGTHYFIDMQFAWLPAVYGSPAPGLNVMSCILCKCVYSKSVREFRALSFFCSWQELCKYFTGIIKRICILGCCINKFLKILAVFGRVYLTGAAVLGSVLLYGLRGNRNFGLKVDLKNHSVCLAGCPLTWLWPFDLAHTGL